MLRLLALTAAAVLAVLTNATPAAAQKKVALVIGIDAYQSVPRLERAVADSRAMASTLRDLGFRVRSIENADRRAISAGFAAFEEEIDKGDTAFVFFAGHGVEIRGQNLLLPADAPDPNAASEGVLRDNGFLTASLIDRITDRGARAAFFVFDACRNNPYALPGARRSVGATRGLTKVEAPEGVFVLMSAGQNQEALDSLNLPGRPAVDTNANSVFTRVLVEELGKPGLSHIDLAKSVQLRVRDLARGADHAQLPAFYDQIIGTVVLRPGTPVAAAPSTPRPAPVVAPVSPVPPPAPPPGPTADEATWSFIKDTTQAALIEQFIARFPQSPRRREAEARLAELKRLAAVAPPAPIPPPAPPRARVEPVSPQRSWLGTEFTASTPDDAEALGLGTPRGMRIVRVIEGSPAARAGLKLQDVILSANGKTLTVLDELRDLVAATPPGQALDLLLFRDRQEIRVRVTLALIDEDARWSMVQSSVQVALLEQFIADFPQSPRRRDAEARLAELEKQRLAAVAPPPAEAADDRTRKPGETFTDCPECPEMVVVPSGSFQMGSPPTERGRDRDEGPQRQVSIARPFAVGKFEVTFTEWDICVQDGGCSHRPDDSNWGREKQPVIDVSWQDAQAYLAWLSRKSGKPYRLLTEAEWEYAARAGTNTPFAFGATISDKDANYDASSVYGAGKRGIYRGRANTVGFYRENAFELFDMHGNVWEWVEDCYRASYANAPKDGAAVTSSDCERRVVRGGGYGIEPKALRSANRDSRTPGDRSSHVGFRVARTLAQ